MNLNLHRYPIGVRLATAWLLMMTIVALLAHLIANDKPLYAKVGSKHFFPAFSGQEWYSENIRFKDLQIIKSDSISIIMPMIPYAPGTSDADNANFKSPFDEQVKSADGKLIKLKNLINKDLIRKINGKVEPKYATTTEFLKITGLKSLKELESSEETDMFSDGR
mgnify:CR=1 FL=1